MLGIYEDGIVTVFYHGKHMKIRPSKIILATGASEKFLEFPGNDLPGIYGAGARILSGLEKARKLRLEHDICRKGGASVC